MFVYIKIISVMEFVFLYRLNTVILLVLLCRTASLWYRIFLFCFCYCFERAVRLWHVWYSIWNEYVVFYIAFCNNQFVINLLMSQISRKLSFYCECFFFFCGYVDDYEGRITGDAWMCKNIIKGDWSMMFGFKFLRFVMVEFWTFI